MTTNDLVHYTLECQSSGMVLQESDRQMQLACAHAVNPALLRAKYHETRFLPGDSTLGLFRFADWLPIRRSFPGASAPVTYHSRGLGSALGLKRLYITFSGYWPERDVTMMSGTFKECEAYAVCARIPEEHGCLVVASAGNTARAFIRVCSLYEIPVLIVIPERNLNALWSTIEVPECVTVIAVGDDADYSDAIRVADMICQLDGFFAEGGARNVARRAGMSTTVLSAAEEIRAIPDWYFQAVGSGTGVIAAWEAALLLRSDGSFGNHTMRIVAVQNAPFQPIHDAWQARSRQLITTGINRHQINALYAPVLSNRTPPYSIIGGVYDALRDSNGETLAVGNQQAINMGATFAELEGITITPAAAVAVAGLAEAAQNGMLNANDCVMLNITGGGIELLFREQPVYAVKPRFIVHRRDWQSDTLSRLLERAIA